MPPLIRLFVGFIFRAIIVSIVFALTLLRGVYERIQDLNSMSDTMSGSRLSHGSSSISNKPAENNPSQDMTATTLAIENVQDTASTNESPEANNENVVSNEEREHNNDENFSQVVGNSNDNQPRSVNNSSYISVNTNDENIQEGNQNDIDEMIVATLAFVLQCSDMCVIL